MSLGSRCAIKRALAYSSPVFAAVCFSCYPDFRFDGSSSQSGTTSTGVVQPTLPCVFDADAGAHVTTCAPGESCCFARAGSGLPDECAPRGGCGEKLEYRCRAKADCATGSCCSPVELVDGGARLRGSNCEPKGCTGGMAELCDPSEPEACTFPLVCTRVEGSYGACYSQEPDPGSVDSGG